MITEEYYCHYGHKILSLLSRTILISWSLINGNCWHERKKTYITIYHLDLRIFFTNNKSSPLLLSQRYTKRHTRGLSERYRFRGNYRFEWKIIPPVPSFARVTPSYIIQKIVIRKTSKLQPTYGVKMLRAPLIFFPRVLCFSQ